MSLNNLKEKPQSQEEWQNQMAQKVLRYVQKELYQDLRFLDVALSALVWQPLEGIATLATDGSRMYFPAERICRIFQTNPLYLNRVYLHEILHCLFSHLWLQQGREKALWDTACDIEVEYVVDHLEKSSVKRALSWQRQQMYREMEEKKSMSAAKIYADLLEKNREEQEKLRVEFYTDNHKFWPEEEKKSPVQNQAKDMWDKISRQSQMQKEQQGREPEKGEQTLLRRLKVEKSRRSYREFLRKFAVLREEMQCDPDTFDLNFYTYGLELYGNMPLIEPVESREIMRIQEFVVVLDTSYSTDGELIKRFLRETFTLLTEKDSFFHKCHIRILQCDDGVREDTKITDTAEMETFLQQFTVVGGGGTDFRPAFSYVAGLQEKGELRQLRGLLYFTDGKGIYPAKPPNYDVAFCYLDDYEKEQVPPWAMRFEIGGTHEY